jgi:RNA polymerase sigma factor (sigma-70 family)
MSSAAPGPRGSFLSERSWDDLFDFLDPDRREKQGSDRDRDAEASYQMIVRKLTVFFAGRGCGDAEDLAVESVLRVAGRCGNIETIGREDRVRYFYGVARNVLHEWHRGAVRESTKREALRGELGRWPVSDPQSWSRREAVQRCLDLCLAKLSPRASRLIVSYYREERAARIESHRALANELGKSVNALRIEVHRIRNTLRQCVVACLGPGPEGQPG